MTAVLDRNVGHDTPDQPTITNVSSQLGAPMGRVRWFGQPVAPLRLFEVRLDNGGYDRGGAYWGLRRPGQRLYCCTDTEAFRVFVDAPDRTTARRQVDDTLASRGLTGTYAKD